MKNDHGCLKNYGDEMHESIALEITINGLDAQCIDEQGMNLYVELNNENGKINYTMDIWPWYVVWAILSNPRYLDVFVKAE